MTDLELLLLTRSLKFRRSVWEQAMEHPLLKPPDIFRADYLYDPRQWDKHTMHFAQFGVQHSRGWTIEKIANPRDNPKHPRNFRAVNWRTKILGDKMNSLAKPNHLVMGDLETAHFVSVPDPTAGEND